MSAPCSPAGPVGNHNPQEHTVSSPIQQDPQIPDDSTSQSYESPSTVSVIVSVLDESVQPSSVSSSTPQSSISASSPSRSIRSPPSRLRSSQKRPRVSFSEADLAHKRSSPTSPLRGNAHRVLRSRAAPVPTPSSSLTHRYIPPASAPSTGAEPAQPATRHVGSAAVRGTARVATYVAYDAASAYVPRDAARVVKVFAELAIDELAPPPYRSQMTLVRCFLEHLAPCGVSSLLSFLLRAPLVRAAKPAGVGAAAAVVCRPSQRCVVRAALWTVAHRILRQALIYRLFFRIGSSGYNVATLLGCACCFFREELFVELHRIGRWPYHFSLTQGVYAIARTIAYSVTFLLPIHKVGALGTTSVRASNVKKLIFATVLANSGSLRPLLAVLRRVRVPLV